MLNEQATNWQRKRSFWSLSRRDAQVLNPETNEKASNKPRGLWVDAGEDDDDDGDDGDDGDDDNDGDDDDDDYDDDDGYDNDDDDDYDEGANSARRSLYHIALYPG